MNCCIHCTTDTLSLHAIGRVGNGGRLQIPMLSQPVAATAPWRQQPLRVAARLRAFAFQTTEVTIQDCIDVDRLLSCHVTKFRKAGELAHSTQTVNGTYNGCHVDTFQFYTPFSAQLSGPSPTQIILILNVNNHAQANTRDEPCLDGADRLA
jgi:hypothetical protein